MFRSYKLIFTRKLIVIAMCLLINSLALAANIDFKSINNNAYKNCSNHQTEENYTNVNGLDSACQHGKSNETITRNEASKDDLCKNVKNEESYVEPKFSTKKPRGQ